MDEEYFRAERAAGRLADELVHRAQWAGLTVATAESCTAGLVSAAIASVPGASDVLVGGGVTYCNRLKCELLGVSAQTIEAFTEVSEQTACEMAQGARRVFAADLSVSLTGYAGPGGGTERDPAGTVYIATCSDAGTACERCSFAGSRNAVRAQAAARALELLLRLL